MFRVLCIKMGEWRYLGGMINGKGPHFGEILTVEKEFVNFGVPVYVLAEYPESDGGYDKSRFIPLSNIDEKELSTNKNLDYANI